MCNKVETYSSQSSAQSCRRNMNKATFPATTKAEGLCASASQPRHWATRHTKLCVAECRSQRCRRITTRGRPGRWNDDGDLSEEQASVGGAVEGRRGACPRLPNSGDQLVILRYVRSNGHHHLLVAIADDFYRRWNASEVEQYNRHKQCLTQSRYRRHGGEGSGWLLAKRSPFLVEKYSFNASWRSQYIHTSGSFSLRGVLTNC